MTQFNQLLLPLSQIEILINLFIHTTLSNISVSFCDFFCEKVLYDEQEISHHLTVNSITRISRNIGS